jgi:hypothetical protein
VRGDATRDPEGGKDTGTGTSRRYGANEVRKAAMLVELAHFRIPAPVLELTFEDTERWTTAHEWQMAVRGDEVIFLNLAYTDGDEGTILSQVIVASSERNLLVATARDPAFNFASAVVINLTKLFAKVRV